MSKEIHFYESRFAVPYPVPRIYFTDWRDTLRVIDEGCEVIHTTQMGLMNTGLLSSGWRIFVHEDIKTMYEIKLGSDNERTNREIKLSHDLFKLWKNGEFAKGDER